jgi:hypothetical protein
MLGAFYVLPASTGLPVTWATPPLGSSVTATVSPVASGAVSTIVVTPRSSVIAAATDNSCIEQTRSVTLVLQAVHRPREGW